jgi:hypothetical protein
LILINKYIEMHDQQIIKKIPQWFFDGLDGRLVSFFLLWNRGQWQCVVKIKVQFTPEQVMNAQR